jgi:hypothetical protein
MVRKVKPSRSHFSRMQAEMDPPIRLGMNESAVLPTTHLIDRHQSLWGDEICLQVAHAPAGAAG